MIHYLADDDFYDIGRFKAFEGLFNTQGVVVGYGRLMYVSGYGHPTGRTRYYKDIDDPLKTLDHNQVAHRRNALDKVHGWSRGVYDDYSPDGHFFRKLRVLWGFHGADAVVAYKREHTLNMQMTKQHTTGHRE